MELIIISAASFLTAILTFFSGFGLGTVLTPLFMIYFPADVAIALTGIVHFFNNIFKLILVGKYTDWQVLIKFGIPAVLAAIVGAFLLLNISNLPVLFEYTFNGKNIEVLTLKFVISVLLIIFALLELIPNFNNLNFGKDKLMLGGALSGFFGGLSGNQGALRSAFLIKAGLSKETFIGTTAVVSTFVDFTRLSIYASSFNTAGLEDNLTLVLSATLAGIMGSFVGNKLLKKVTLKLIQRVVAILLILVSVALGAGLI